MSEREPNLNPDDGSLDQEAQKDASIEVDPKALFERLGLIVRTISDKPDLVVTSEVDPEHALQARLSEGKDLEREWFHARKIDKDTGELLQEYVHIPKYVTESPEDALGKASHEAGHVAITRLGEVAGDELQATGMHGLVSALEERATDQVVRQRYSGAGQWVDGARMADVKAGESLSQREGGLSRIPKFVQLCSAIVSGGVQQELPDYYDANVRKTYNSIQNSIQELEMALPKEGASEEDILDHARKRYNIARKKIWPKIKRMVKNDIRQSAEQDLLDRAVKSEEQEGAEQADSSRGLQDLNLPDSVKEALDKLLEKIREEKSQPSPESEVSEDPHGDHQRDGVGQKEDDKDESSDQEGQDDKDISVEEGDKSGVDDDSAPDAMDEPQEQSEANADMGDGQAEGAEPNDVTTGTGTAEQGDGAQSEESEEEPDDFGEDSTEEVDDASMLKSDVGTSPAEQEDDSSKSSETEEDVAEEREDVALEDLSPEMQKQLKKIFDQLPKQTKEQLMQEAEAQLQEMEDAVVKDLEGKFIEDKAETHQDYDAKDREDKTKEGEGSERTEDQEELLRSELDRLMDEERKAQEEVYEMERRMASLHESVSSDRYEIAYQEVSSVIEPLYRELEQIFHPTRKGKVRYRHVGQKINLDKIRRMEAGLSAGASEIDSKVFEVMKAPEKRDYVFTILVDLSGSMGRGEKIQETFKGVVVLTEVINRLGIPVEVLGFQDEVIRFKDFDDRLSDEVRRKISGMVGEVYNNNPGGHNVSTFNDDGPCLLDASASLEDRPERGKFLLVLSDGIPEGRVSGERDLVEAIKKIMTETKQKIIGVGLGNGTEHVERFYPTSLPNVNTRELAETLGGLLRDMIINPQRYTGRSGKS